MLRYAKQILFEIWYNAAWTGIITRPEFFNPVGTGGACLFNQPEDFEGVETD